MVASGRAKKMALTADGAVHTVSMELKSLRSIKGYIRELGLYFEKDGAPGNSVLIQSIRFVEPAEDAE